MSFTLGGKTAAELKVKMLEGSQIPILPPTDDRLVPIPGRPGAYDFGADLQPRPFKLECGFIDAVLDSDVKLQEAVRDFAAHLINENGQPREMTLVFDMEP